MRQLHGVAFGALKALDYGNTRSLAMTYNSRLQPASFTVPGVLSKTYDYQADDRSSFSHDLINAKFDRSYSYAAIQSQTTVNYDASTAS